MHRRSFLRYVGVALGALQGSRYFPASPAPGLSPGGFAGSFSELARPVPAAGEKVASRFELVDDLLLPPGFRHEILARWGDRFGAVDFGANADHTAILPIPGRPGRYHLLVNHEYISLIPWQQGFRAAKGRDLPLLGMEKKRLRIGDFLLEGVGLDLEELVRAEEGTETEDASGLVGAQEDARRICREALEDLGFSLLELELTEDGGLRVATDGLHRRIHAIGSVGVADEDRPRFAGPGASRLGSPPGTMSNCSGGTSPWGTFFSCEENFQDYTTHEVAADGGPTSQRKHFGISGWNETLSLPKFLQGIGQGAPGGPLDGRHFGWVGEVDPATGRLTKHILLGRFRHENVAVAARAGRRLAIYMGDDARGGHVWKYVSKEPVEDPAARANSGLLEDGSLMVARFAADGSGRWLALEPETPLSRPRLELCAGGALLVPRRSAAGDPRQGGLVRLGKKGLPVDDWIAEVESFAGKEFAKMTLGDLVRPEPREGENGRDAKRWVLLMEAYAMANCIGATPAARPEDLECEFSSQGALNVFIAFTDFDSDDDGSPDREVFPGTEGATSRRYGAIRHLAEKEGDPAALKFSWGEIVSSGETTEEGGGFAAPDNIAVDPDGELWFLTDMSMANAEVEDRERVPPGSKDFQGIFGNNAMWWLPSSGRPRCFAQGPMEAELTGPTFLRTASGETMLLLSVQHPGEANGRRDDDAVEERHFAIRESADRIVRQRRVVPLGSNFAAREDGVPRSAVCLVRRRSEMPAKPKPR